MADVADRPSPAGPGERRRWSRGAKIQLALLGVNVAFWGGILGWSVAAGEDAYDPPDRLEDPAFAAAAGPICAAAKAEIDDLGLPTEVESPAERAELVLAGDEILTDMVVDLAGLPRPSGEEGEWVGLWLADWRVHIADRTEWAQDLLRGDDGPFTESDRGGEQISNVVDNFAQVNDMDSCATSGDV